MKFWRRFPGRVSFGGWLFALLAGLLIVVLFAPDQARELLQAIF